MASATYSPTNQPSSTTEKALEKGKDAVHKAEEMAAETFGKVKEAGTHVLDKAKETAGCAGDMAKETASAVGRKADDLTAAAGHEIREFGDTVGRKAPHEGMAGHASQAVADTIKGTGQYIEDAKLSGMAHDLERTIKNHPIPALLVCLGIGFCVGRALKD